MTVYALNAETLGVSEYDLDAVDVLSADGADYILAPTALKEFAGDSDDGADIDAYIQLGRMHFGDPSLGKTIAAAYVIGAADSGVVATVQAELEGAEVEYDYPEPGWPGDDNARRVVFGAGLQSRYPGLKLANVAGGSFEIKHLALGVHTTKRRVYY